MLNNTLLEIFRGVLTERPDKPLSMALEDNLVVTARNTYQRKLFDLFSIEAKFNCHGLTEYIQSYGNDEVLRRMLQDAECPVQCQCACDCENVNSGSQFWCVGNNSKLTVQIERLTRWGQFLLVSLFAVAVGITVWNWYIWRSAVYTQRSLSH